jgi:hypothetical protein
MEADLDGNKCSRPNPDFFAPWQITSRENTLGLTLSTSRFVDGKL